MFNDGINTALGILCGGMIGIGGWLYAHQTIALECEKLGAFYVGAKVFACEEKK